MSIIGQTLGGRYQVLNFLGKGGFGETYLAKDLHLPDKPFRVIKKLQSNFSPKIFVKVKEWFDREANTLYTIDHEQIPQLFAHFEEKKDFYLVQEYIDGLDLTHEIYPGKQLNEPEVIEMLLEILDILTIVHARKIIHRDLKPSNIMRRTSDKKVILIDFGNVKEVTSQIRNIPGKEVKTLPIESPGYTPIEQKIGNPQFCSDIYALGIIAIQALTGLHPTGILKDPITCELVWQDKASVSPKLAKIINKMIRQNYQERYQSTKEILRDFTPTTIPCNSPSSIPIVQPKNNTKTVKHLLQSMGLAVTLTAIPISIFIWLQQQSKHNSQPINPIIELAE